METTRFIRLNLISAVIAACCSVTSAQVTIYSDDFSGGGAALDGAATDVGGGAWAANSAFLDNGTVNLADEGSALLPFAPTINNIYELSIDLTNPGNEWFGLGFAQDPIASPGASNFEDRLSNAVDGIAWMLYRNNGAANAIQSFTGLNTGGPADLSSTGIDFNASNELKIILNTAGDGSSFTADWQINGNSLRSETIGIAVDSLNFVGVTYNNTSDQPITFDNFLLTEEMIAQPTSFWNVDGGGSFNTAGNWSTNVTPTSTANFGGVLTAANSPATVTLDSAVSLGAINFNNGAASYDLAGPSTLTLNGDATVDVVAGQHTISAPISGAAGLTKTGGGVLTISNAANTYGNTTVSGGTLQVTNVAAAGAGGATVTASAGSTFQFGAGANGTFSAALAGTGTTRFATSLTTEQITLGGANGSFAGVVSVGGGTAVVNTATDLGVNDGTAAAGTVVDGGASTGTLQVAATSIGNERLQLDARTAGNFDPHLTSTGVTSWAGPVVGALGGSEYNIESQSGTLTLSGDISTPDDVANPGPRNFNLTGAGNGLISGAIIDSTLADGDGAEIANVHVYKRGAGTWTIATGTGNRDDFHQGVTVIEEGTLAVQSTAGDVGELWSSDTQVRSGAFFNVTSFGTYSMQEGGLALSGAGTVVANTLEIYSDISLNPGDDGVGTLSVNGNVTMSNFGTGGVWNYDLGNTTSVGGGESDLIAVSGNLTSSAGSLAVTLSVTPVEGTLATGPYRLMTHSSGSAPAVGSITTQVVDNNGAVLNPRQSLSVSSTTTQVNANVSGSSAAITWNGTAGVNSWDVATSNNWTGGSTNFRDLDQVTFGSGGVKDVTVNERVTPGSVAFSGGAGSTYTLSGSGGITGFGPVNINSGAVQLNNSGNAYAGTTTIASGARLEMTTNASVGGMVVNGTFALPNNTMVTMVDDFDTPGLGQYSFSKVLDQGTVTNVSFSDAAGTIDVTSTGADGAEQVLLLRNDVTLAQGQELQLDAPTTFMDRDFGLAVGQTHADLGDGGTGDNRTAGDYLFIAWRSLAQLNGRGFNGNAEIALEQEFGVNAERLFIARTDNDDIELGWYQDGNRMVSYTATPATLDIFSNLGFYADVRTDGNGFAGADNLRIVTGSGADIINIDGDFDLGSSGTLQIDLTETGLATLNITGSALLDGVVDIDLVGGFMPDDGQEFTILTASEILTALGDITFDLPTNFTASIVDSTDLVLTFSTGGLDGDFNGDGIVDAIDYAVWRENLGLSDAALNGNGTGDASGLVVSADFDLWKANYGATSPGAAGGQGSASVPEPTALVLLLTIGLLLQPTSRKRN